MRYANELIEDLEALPYGDPEGDHSLLDKYTLETLKLCLEAIQQQDNFSYDGDLNTLIFSLIQKWEAMEGTLWYA